MEFQQNVAQASVISYVEGQTELSSGRVSLKDKMLFVRTAISITA